MCRSFLQKVTSCHMTWFYRILLSAKRHWLQETKSEINQTDLDPLWVEFLGSPGVLHTLLTLSKLEVRCWPVGEEDVVRRVELYGVCVQLYGPAEVPVANGLVTLAHRLQKHGLVTGTGAANARLRRGDCLKTSKYLILIFIHWNLVSWYRCGGEDKGKQKNLLFMTGLL